MPIASEIYYHGFEGGDAESPPVVLIHGAGGNHLYWPVELRRLPGYRVYAIDLPGHGKSGGCGQQSISAYAHSVMEWLTSLRMNSAVFAGHSMGSAIALELALNYPDQVLGLALVGSGARLRVNPDILTDCASPTTFHNAVDTIIANNFSTHTGPRLIELAHTRMLETRQSVLHGDLLACEGFDVTERVGSIDQPTLIICGTEDKMTPLRYSQFLASAIPSAHLEVITQAGHMVMLEKPQEVAERLASFLSRITGQPGAAAVGYPLPGVK